MESLSLPTPIGSKVVAPDPSIASAIGRHHTLATAVADLIDNSIDVEAENILVRFLVDGVRPVGLQVIDDGWGMDNAGIDDAMTYAKKREYQGQDLGHFGIGLKAASLSQANTLLVWSRRWGSPAVGRRLRRESIDTGPRVEEFSPTDADRRLNAIDVDFPMETGTVVEWRDVQTFLTSSVAEEQLAWTNRTTQELVNHLGLVLHRILAAGTLNLRIENYDVAAEFAGPARTVAPIDPFGYRAHTRLPYPKDLPVLLGDAQGTAHLHIWPYQDRGPGFVQGGRSPSETQGLYIYRRNRLLQAGGWNGLASPSVNLSYARIAFDLSDAMEHHVIINPEKAGTTFDDELRHAFARATAVDGLTLASYREDAKRQARISRHRVAAPIEAPPPGDGLPKSVKEAFVEYTVPNGRFPIDVRWRLLPEDRFYRVDLDEHALTLNARYRTAVIGRRSLDLDDAPLVKSLLLLLIEDHFEGTGGGAKKKRQEAAWQAVLLAACQAQSVQEVENLP